MHRQVSDGKIPAHVPHDYPYCDYNEMGNADHQKRLQSAVTKTAASNRFAKNLHTTHEKKKRKIGKMSKLAVLIKQHLDEYDTDHDGTRERERLVEVEGICRQFFQVTSESDVKRIETFKGYIQDHSVIFKRFSLILFIFVHYRRMKLCIS